MKGHEQGAGDVLFLDLGSGDDECVYFAVVYRSFILALCTFLCVGPTSFFFFW